MEKAEEYLRLVLRIGEQTGDPVLTIIGRVEQSWFLWLKNDVPAGRTWAEDALKHARRLNIRFLEGIALIELALLSWQQEDFPRASENLSKARSFLEPAKANYELARIAFYKAAIS